MTDKFHGSVAVVIDFVFSLTEIFLASRAEAQQNKSSYETGDAPLREGPGNFHKIITTLPKGMQINVVGKEGYWLKVESKHGGRRTVPNAERN